MGEIGKEPRGSRVSGDLHDTLTEIQRIESVHWGNPLNAAIMRCVAATRIKAGRAARVSDIASALDVGVSTVHDRLRKLQDGRGPANGRGIGYVRRTQDGYAETEAGRLLNDTAAREIERTLMRLMRRMR